MKTLKTFCFEMSGKSYRLDVGFGQQCRLRIDGSPAEKPSIREIRTWKPHMSQAAWSLMAEMLEIRPSSRANRDPNRKLELDTELLLLLGYRGRRRLWEPK